jgi:lipid II:glycine glycyltransferase (peptidoglycan interpeptide bridge formation enzyme)
LRLNLNTDVDQIFSAFRKSTRYEVRRAERSAAAVSSAGSDHEASEFLTLYVNMAGTKGFSPDPVEHLKTIISWLREDESRGALMLAKSPDAVLGGAIIVRAGQRCWFVWGASQKTTDFSVGHLLQWHALLWAKSHGCTEYDFGGYTPGATSGPAWFKAGFGGSVVSFVAPHRRILRPTYWRVIDTFTRRRSRAYALAPDNSSNEATADCASG